MVVVRESPRAKQSPDKGSTEWPPKSPFHALMSSPSGRQKWRDYGRRDDGARSPSPSPAKRVTTSAALRALSAPSDGEEEDDEDEETMQLKLQEIQAKLKLKELQRQRKKAMQSGEDMKSETDSRATSRADSVANLSPRRPLKPSSIQPRHREPEIEVPLSPSKERMTIAKEPLSPARVRLGLSAATRAQDVSLKRHRTGAQNTPSGLSSRRDTDTPPSRSFSERLAASRTQAEDQIAKQDRIQQSRSSGFGSVSSAISQSRSILGNRSGLRDETGSIRSPSIKSPSSMVSPASVSSLRERSTLRGSALSSASNTPRLHAARTEQMFQSMHPDSTNLDKAKSQKEPEESSSSYDPFSEIHLSKRNVPHIDVARAMEDGELYTLPRLLKEVKAPHYEAPDCEGNFVVFAILASKSSPYDQKVIHKTSDSNKPQDDAQGPRNKFMVFKLCDLKWEVDCFLFGTAFDQFWKLTPGTLLAILNPMIMPPKVNQHNGRFTLKLGSSEDCVMEIGQARDLGYCVSIKKDGQKCGTWVDKRKTEVCEFHINMLVEKQRKGRMEVNTMWRGGMEKPQANSKARDGDYRKKNNKWHGEYGNLYSVPTGMPGGKSAASLLDADDTDALHDMTREEASRKRIAAAQKERDLAKRLGEMGNGVGAEYLRASTGGDKPAGTAIPSSSANTGPADYFDKPKIADLGLLGRKADAVHLSPAKDRKRHFGLGAAGSKTTGGGKAAIGWGGARKANLWPPPSMPAPPPPATATAGTGTGTRSPTRTSTSPTREKGQTLLPRAGIVRERSHDTLAEQAADDGSQPRSGSQSPRKKRARFALSRGIREPGRESLGSPAFRQALNADDDDDDDDDLDILG